MLAAIAMIAGLTACGAGEKGAAGMAGTAAGKGVFSQVKTKSRALKDTGDEAGQAPPISESGFAFSLGQKLLADAPEADNFVYSPLSVWLPLAALANATDAEHRPALLAALGAAGVSEAQLNEYAQTLLYRVAGEGNKKYSPGYISPLKIANALFVSRHEKARQKFAQTFADSYLGAMFNVDFASQEAVGAVNSWASEHTEGLIDRIIESFDPGTAAAIANAIYYSDRWDLEFGAEETQSDVFHATGGDMAADYMKREDDSLRYYEDERAQAVSLGLKNGGSMWIILPKAGTANRLLAGMDADYFDEMRNGSRLAMGKLLLPKFEAESGLNLGDALAAIGVPLFDATTAPLTGGLLESDAPVWISDALQKAVIKVDEKGTTAAAVTLLIAASGMPRASQPAEPFEMVCDRPFAFVLENYGQILFAGAVNAPTEAR
jgi:serpin B